ncbi:PfkB family carbohydrate kinase [Streptomyces sp. NPDC056309]|uniref:PfkB family carbohydrate kinase n=1 Tax=unclassified Streptomyces TaxID=2593676 RepID=UPI0035D7262A
MAERVRVREIDDVHRGGVPGVPTIDPTGVGDAFRAGFLAALSHALPLPAWAA